MNPPLERWLRPFPLAILLLAAAALIGCGTTQYRFPAAENAGSDSAAGSTPVSVRPAGTRSETGSSTNQSPDWLQPGDKITITFSGIHPPPPKHEEKIREDGNINPPLLGRSVKAAGKTIGKLQEELQNLYVPAFFTRALTVTVATEERWFFVGGEVKNPYRFIYSGGSTVLKAIQTAGDFTPFADRKRVKVIRANGRTETVNCDRALKNPKLDLPIFPGDQVIVPQRWF